MKKHGEPISFAETPVGLDDLRTLADRQAERLAKANAGWALRMLRRARVLKPVHLYLSDLTCGVRYGLFEGLTEANIPREDCALALSSSAFAATLRNGYGYSTLWISGRFRELKPGSIVELSRHFFLPAQNEQGLGLPRLLWRDDSARRMLRYLRTRIFRAKRKVAHPNSA
jgi:hypothetical protein